LPAYAWYNGSQAPGVGYIYSGTRTVFAWEILGAGAAEAMVKESASTTKAVFDIYIIENESF